ncbi:glycerate kinase [Diaphorobacter nitroreducens]|uniref:glycerate kinase n=1 Tax=Diaphorobacter nitroreducens TaxID=164759 RepID=UPI0028B1C196|nr:glycerate kinase [Diaphorobacter nitroreducens]
MNLRKILIPAGIVVLVIAAYRAYGPQGILTVSGGLVMWGLLHYTRLMNVMQKARNHPIGYVGSAVMLNAKLKAGVNLLHVVAMTRALGQQLSADGQQPELYRWTDGTQSHVTCEFVNGRLVRWELVRPAPQEDAGPPAVANPAGES